MVGFLVFLFFFLDIVFLFFFVFFGVFDFFHGKMSRLGFYPGVTKGLSFSFCSFMQFSRVL